MRFERGYTFTKKHVILYEWRINEISSYFEKNNDEVIYKLDLESPKFSVGADEQKKWYLRLKSASDPDEDKTWLSLFLHYSSSKESEVKTKYFLFILNDKKERVNVSEFHKWFKNDGDGWICAEFVKKADLEEKKDELLPDDTLTIGIELTVYDDSTTFSTYITLEEPKSQMVADYKRLFESKEGCDVVIKVKDETFEAHKTILMARSEMFFKLFTVEMKESKEEFITLSDIEPEIFNSLLEFIYIDEVSDLDVVVEDLLEAADRFLIESLKSMCVESLIKLIKIDNAVRFLSLAERHNAPQLLTHVTDFIVLNVEDIIKSREFKIMEKSNPSLALILFRKFAALKTDGTFLFSDSAKKAK
ncbi:speckle-type POZ protein-like [Cotesia glomerata]|uniref:speckle-type POZ protein-like n=1 Tax=Cotesia glomerata TaxID=32391 RepID=UPI001D0359ED|nr:speckle-type POZ protein-like [Cotesia glomerata]